MADISQITLPSGTTYNLKDAWAREQIETLVGGNAVVFRGVSSTALSDGGNENPTVNSAAVTTKNTGDLYFYNKEEFIYGSDSKWHSLGPQLQNLGNLAYKDSVTVKYDKTTSITSSFFGEEVVIPVGPSRTGVGSTHIHNVIVNGSNSTFTGEKQSFNVPFTPSGSISYTKKNETISGNYTPSGTISQVQIPSETVQSTGLFTPSGTVSIPTISLNTAGSTATIKNPTKVTVAKTVAAAAPTSTVSNEITYYNVANQNLTLYKIGYTTGDSITTSNVTVKTGDATYKSSRPSFTGTENSVEVEGLYHGFTTTPTFTGREQNLSYTIEIPSTFNFSGSAGHVQFNYTPNGTVSFNVNTESTSLAASYTPTGTVTSTPNNTNTNATVSYS